MKLIARLICRYKGHVWRRLRKSEPAPDGLLEQHGYRICARCQALRDVKRRKS